MPNGMELDEPFMHVEGSCGNERAVSAVGGSREVTCTGPAVSCQELVLASVPKEIGRSYRLQSAFPSTITTDFHNTARWVLLVSLTYRLLN